MAPRPRNAQRACHKRVQARGIWYVRGLQVPSAAAAAAAGELAFVGVRCCRDDLVNLDRRKPSSLRNYDWSIRDAKSYPGVAMVTMMMMTGP